MNLDLSSLRRTLLKKTGEEESVRAVLSLTLYSPLSVREIAPHAAKAVQKYIEVIPGGTLTSALVGDEIGPLTARRIARDLQRLAKPPKNLDYDALHYFSGSSGPPSDFGLTLILDEFEDTEESETGLLRFEFPCDSAEGDRVQPFLDQLCSIANCVPFSAGTAGFGFSHWQFDRYAQDQAYALLPRYIGFDHSGWVPAQFMRGRAPTANWLTLLNTALLEELGGAARLAECAPEVQLTPLAHGVMIRAAYWPVVGDINAGAPDVASLPGLARWLEPVRVTFPSLRGYRVDVDVPAWLARFEGLPNGPWNNR